jgi:hypothetical protein
MGFRLDITDYPICAWEGYTFLYVRLFLFLCGGVDCIPGDSDTRQGVGRVLNDSNAVYRNCTPISPVRLTIPNLLPSFSHFLVILSEKSEMPVSSIHISGP